MSDLSHRLCLEEVEFAPDNLVCDYDGQTSLERGDLVVRLEDNFIQGKSITGVGFVFEIHIGNIRAFLEDLKCFTEDESYYPGVGGLVKHSDNVKYYGDESRDCFICGYKVNKDITGCFLSIGSKPVHSFCVPSLIEGIEELCEKTGFMKYGL